MTQARTSRSNREKYLQDQGEERVWIITSCGNIDSEDSMIPSLSFISFGMRQKQHMRSASPELLQCLSSDGQHC